METCPWPHEDNFSYFFDDLPRRASFQAELHQWHELWRDKKDEEKPKTISEALGKCDKVFFRNVFTILKICATFPVTSCECERSVSVLRPLKTYLRTSMSQERMTSLALMYVHRETDIKVTDIVSQFARKKPRRMMLPNILLDDEGEFQESDINGTTTDSEDDEEERVEALGNA